MRFGISFGLLRSLRRLGFFFGKFSQIVYLNQRIQNFSRDHLCPWCRVEEESIQHLFWDCLPTRRVWEFIGKWWSVSNTYESIPLFSLIRMFKLISKKQLGKIWVIVVAAACWTIWLARNEKVFKGSSLDKATLEFLIFQRINKWGEASKLINFSDDSLWKVNPQGAIAIHHYTPSNSFWKFKFLQFDLVCVVDGALGHNSSG